MSIATMINLGIQRQRELIKPEEPSVAELGAKKMSVVAPENYPQKTVDSALEKISAFIPSEVIGIYVAGFGILSPSTGGGKWWIFFICIALIPVIMGLNYLDQQKLGRVVPPFRIGVLLLVLAIVAFTAWAAAMPDTPFLSFSARATAFGGWAVIILAVVMYRVADLLGVVPTSQ